MKTQLNSANAQIFSLPRRSTATGLIAFAALCFFSIPGFSADTNALAKFQNVHRIIFLGDSITYAGFYVADINAYYDTRFPDEHFEFINLGLSSENVSGLSEEGHAGGKFRRPDLHERLGRVLEKSKPDLAILVYGMNDGIYQPWDEGRFKAFRDGMKSVHDQIAAAGVKMIHVTPPIFDSVDITNKLATNAAAGGFSRPYGGYDEVLGRYSEWLLTQRTAGWEVADLHGPMSRWLADQRQHNPDFRYTKDGVHPDEAGHWVMAKQILLYLGAKDVENAGSSAAMLAANPHGEEIWKLEHRKEQLLRDAWLNFCGFIRPGLKGGLPVPEAEAKAAELDKQIHQLAN
jgi:lysophospholipase L1-like esterase